MLLLKIIQTIIHYGLHFVFPIVIAKKFYKEQWLKIYAILLATMLVDLDHLLANPIFDPNRCSVGFHYFHSYYAIGLYLLLLIQKNTIIRVISIGLLLHMFTDGQDCLWNTCTSLTLVAK